MTTDDERKPGHFFIILKGALENDNLQEVLEQVVDAIGLPQVLDCLRQIAIEKAEHIDANWQDKALAQVWSRASIKLDVVACSEAIRNTWPTLPRK